jgi:hypothetical protein
LAEVVAEHFRSRPAAVAAIAPGAHRVVAVHRARCQVFGVCPEADYMYLRCRLPFSLFRASLCDALDSFFVCGRDGDLRQRRLARCAKCPHYVGDAFNPRCERFRCTPAYGQALSQPAGRCPVGNWAAG